MDPKELLAQFISIKSVSTNSKYSQEIKNAVRFLKNTLEKLGFKTLVLTGKKSHPLLFASLKVKNAVNTVGIYGHYDVQPEDPIGEWKTPPFQLKEEKGKFFGRGVADNKGHIIVNIAAISKLLQKHSLKSNIVFLLEGEEELGSPSLENYLIELKEELEAVDFFLITDVGMHKKNVPQIFYGLRGLCYFELIVKTGERDLHSGVYGNRVINPANLICELIGKMKDAKTNKVLIPGFYKDVRKLTSEERKLLKKIEKTEEEEKAESKAFVLTSLDKENPSLSTKIYPSLDVNGIISGYTGEGQKTVIPKEARVKFSCRLVEYQEPNQISKLIKKFIKSQMPANIQWKLIEYYSASPFYTSINNKYVKKTARILKEVFGKEPVFNRSGGTIPAAEILQRLFKKPIILTGFTLPDDNIHAPNENFDKQSFFKGIEVIKRLLGEN